ASPALESRTGSRSANDAGQPLGGRHWLSHDHADLMTLAVIRQLNHLVRARRAVQRHALNAALDAVWILDGDMVGRGAMPIRDGVLAPVTGDAGIEREAVATELEAEKGLQG